MWDNRPAMSLAQFIYTEVLKPKPLKALANAILLRIIPETIQVGPAILHLDLTDPVVSGALTSACLRTKRVGLFPKILPWGHDAGGHRRERWLIYGPGYASTGCIGTNRNL